MKPPLTMYPSPSHRWFFVFFQDGVGLSESPAWTLRCPAGDGDTECKQDTDSKSLRFVGLGSPQRIGESAFRAPLGTSPVRKEQANPVCTFPGDRRCADTLNHSRQDSESNCLWAPRGRVCKAICCCCVGLSRIKSGVPGEGIPVQTA